MAARTLKPEDLISHYRIVGPLGAGGMGEVYRAKDQTLERDVALKILPAELVRSEDRVRRFVLEAKSASSLNHPHIVTIYEIGQDQVRTGGGAPEPDSSPLHFISMELVSGETLTTKIHREKADLRTLLGYLAQAAEGLSKAHAAGIVHRDLKPGNIMVSKDGYAKVLDFGLAKLTERQASDPALSSAPTRTEDGTSEGVVLGTVGYMSPEQVQGKPVDHRSDVFSFGCILYEAATRRRPFAADSNVETMHKILREEPEPVQKLNREAPAEFRRLIRRCMAKDPNQRLDSMRTLALELREIVEEYGALSASESSGGAAAAIGPAKRRFAIVPTVAAIALVAIAATVWVIGRSGRDRKGTPSGSIRITTETNRGDVLDAALSPDGRYLAYVSGPADQEVVRVRQLATGSDVEILPPQATPPWGLTFSPDGDYLFYLRDAKKGGWYYGLFQIPTLGGTPRQRALDVDAAVTFAPDGKRVCFFRYGAQKRSALIILDLESDKERVLARVELPLSFEQATWSPDGKRIAAVESSPLGSRIVTFRVQDARRDSVGSDPWSSVSSIGWLPDGRHLVVAASERGLPPQIWLQSYPGGQRQKITNDDWTVYDRVSLSADGSTIASRRSARVANLWVAEMAQGRKLRQITFNSNVEHSIFDFDVAEDGSVLFSAGQLFTIGLGGGEANQITAGPSHHFGSAFLPGGSIVFVRSREGGIPHLWRADGDGNNARQVTTGVGASFLNIPARGRISPDGRTVLYRRVDRPDELWALPVGSGKPVRLADLYRGGAAFSPDGSSICYRTFEEVGGQILLQPFIWKIIEVAGGKPIATVMLPQQARDTHWTQDGRALTFLDQGEGSRNVLRQRLDGGGPEQVTHFTTGEITSFDWTSNGSRLVLTRRSEDRENLWMTGADGSHPVQLTDFETGKIFDVKLTRDGRRAIFSHGNESQDVVLIRNFR